jgi:hypothetical protein
MSTIAILFSNYYCQYFHIMKKHFLTYFCGKMGGSGGWPAALDAGVFGLRFEGVLCVCFMQI